MRWPVQISEPRQAQITYRNQHIAVAVNRIRRTTFHPQKPLPGFRLYHYAYAKSRNRLIIMCVLYMGNRSGVIHEYERNTSTKITSHLPCIRRIHMYVCTYAPCNGSFAYITYVCMYVFVTTSWLGVSHFTHVRGYTPYMYVHICMYM
jgi:hypothetical protein